MRVYKKDLLKHFTKEELDMLSDNELKNSIETIRSLIEIFIRIKENSKITPNRSYSKEFLDNFRLEELETFSDYQLKVLNVEDSKSLLRMREDERKEDERIANFWQNEYPQKTTEEKAKYWSGGLFRSMREQEESNLNPYAIYSENWLKETLKVEPNFLELLPHIYNIWGGMFDAGKVDRIIKKLLTNLK